MIIIKSKKNCPFCAAVERAFKNLNIPYKIEYKHNEKIVPQAFDEEGNELFIGLPEFEYIKKLKKKYDNNKN